MKISDCEVDYVLKQKAIIKRFLNPFSFDNFPPYYWCRYWVSSQKMQNNWIQRLSLIRNFHIFTKPIHFLWNKFLWIILLKQIQLQRKSPIKTKCPNIISICQTLQTQTSLPPPYFLFTTLPSSLGFGVTGQGLLLVGFVTRTY